MPVNDGVIELFASAPNGEIRVTIQYDNSGPPGPSQPLVNRNGACLQASNTTGRVLVANVNGTIFNIPARTNLQRSRQQLSQQGFNTRGDVTNASISLE